ncbi:uncharacterized protein [Pseudorasbora parva]|uniref:uncharacterized protein n=1 Tax=Pseudorasbora parva TaxID=51549 RepID=UPI00351E41B5
MCPAGVVVETDGVKSLSVTEGESVTLPNGAEMNKHDLMLWRFGDKGLLLAKIDLETKETSLNDDDERFRDRLKLDQTGSLTITNTRTTDSGLYELQIRGTESLQQFLLSVEAIPDPQLSSGGKAGLSVGVLVPVLLLVAAAFALVYFIRRNSKLKKRMGQEINMSMNEGESPTLSTDLTEIQANDTIEWCYKNETNIIAKINGETRSPSRMDGDDGRFRSKLRLDENTGDLKISNIRTIHSGLYELKIISRSSNRRGCSSKSIIKTKYKRFIVTVNVRTEPVKEGEPVTLNTDTEIRRDDLILWTFGPENRLVVKTESGTTTISESFRDRVQMDKKTASLTITNIRTEDSGHFKLQIINNEQTIFRRFNVTVTGNQEDVSENEQSSLLNRDCGGGNEQQATSSV